MNFESIATLESEDLKLDINNIISLEGEDVYKSRDIYFAFNKIDYKSANWLIERLLKLDKISDEPINIYLNNYGGNVIQGFAIIDTLKNMRSKVSIHVCGACFSMAAIILQAGGERHMTDNSFMMVHVGKYGLEQAHQQNNLNWIDFYKELWGNLLDVLVTSIEKKFNKDYSAARDAILGLYPLSEVKPKDLPKKIDKDDFRKLIADFISFDKILTKKEAQSIGLCD